jgi:catechol 2,3-dioxygenase-like lactoylglutathione lyase family enzyme
MLKDEELMAFVATARPEEAKAFYRDVLGLRLVADEDYALVFEAGGTMLRVQKAGQVSPAPYTALGWKVPRLAPILRALMDRGIQPMRYPHLEQDERGVWQAPGGALVAWFNDPDGNLLSLTQFS